MIFSCYANKTPLSNKLASFWKWRFWKFGIFAAVKKIKTWRYECFSFVTAKTKDFDEGLVPKTSICDDLCDGNFFL